MPFCCGKRSAGICVVLGPKKILSVFQRICLGGFEPAASHLPASSFPRNEGLLGQTPRATMPFSKRLTLRDRASYAIEGSVII
jgi:hypothetical protein